MIFVKNALFLAACLLLVSCNTSHSQKDIATTAMFFDPTAGVATAALMGISNEIGSKQKKDATIEETTETKQDAGTISSVNTIKPVEQNCPQTLSKCDNKSLCHYAIVVFEGEKQWDKRAVVRPYVDEAKRRKLTCDIKDKTASQNPKLVSSAVSAPAAPDDSNETCLTLQKQLKEHIQARNYSEAKEATSLMQSLKCIEPSSSEKLEKKHSNQNSNISCAAGPFFKPVMGKFAPSYRLYSNGQSTNNECEAVRDKCHSLARLKMRRANKSGSISSSNDYELNCDNFTGRCKIRQEDKYGGTGFLGGILSGLNEEADARDYFDMAFKECVIGSGFLIN